MKTKQKISITISILCGLFAIAIPSSAQFGDENYAYLGLTLQSGSITNAYNLGVLHNDKFSGPSVIFGVESYSEGGNWGQFSADGLLLAVVSVVKPTFAPKLTEYEGRVTSNPKSSLYLLSTPLLKWSGAFTPGKQELLGPTVQFGFEGISLLKMDENGKGKKMQHAMGGMHDGVLTYGTGLQLFNPLRAIEAFSNSRLSFNVDWMLARESDEKFRVSGRKRYTVELATMIGRRGYIKAFYQTTDYRKAFYLQSVGGEPIAVNSNMSVIGLGIGLNWLQY